MTLLEKANVFKTELQSECIPNVKLYQSGNMRANIHVVEINDSNVLVVIGVDYASETNDRGRNAGWVEATQQRVADALGGNIRIVTMTQKE